MVERKEILLGGKTVGEMVSLTVEHLVETSADIEAAVMDYFLAAAMVGTLVRLTVGHLDL